MTVLLAAVVLFGLVLVFAGLLGVAKEKLKVYEDPRIGQITEALPAANCGGCGFAGCADFAKAVVEQRVECDGCPVGGSKVAEQVAAILGVEVVKTFPFRPVIHCGAKVQDKFGRVPYEGVQTCSEAHIVGVTQACTYGCLGYGDCVESCNFDALHMVEGVPIVDYAKCTGCGACSKACPRNLIENIPFKQKTMLVVACSNKEPPKLVKQVCTVGCAGCTLCQRLFAEHFQVKDNLSYLNYETYTGDEDLRPLFKKCPAEALVYFGESRPQSAKQLYKEQLAKEAAATPTDAEKN
jgi:RnfABCDGE-type electron transport complex B subunit